MPQKKVSKISELLGSPKAARAKKSVPLKREKKKKEVKTNTTPKRYEVYSSGPVFTPQRTHNVN